MKQLTVDRDPSSVPTYFISMSENAYSALLAADTDTTLAVPTDATLAIISADDYYYVKADGAITLPTGGAGFSEDDAALAFDAINVTDITTLHFRARNVTDISVSFYN